MGFNWYSLPSLASMLLCWLLAAYVLTRGYRTAVALTASAAQVAASCFFLSQLMEANAPSLADWLPWARGLEWSSPVAPTLWYLLTVLLLREQDVEPVRRHLRVAGYPLAALLVVAATALIGADYLGESVFVWSRVDALPVDRATFFRYYAPVTDAYAAYVGLVLLATAGAGWNAWVGWRYPVDGHRQRRFAWLGLSAALFMVGAGSIVATTWLSAEQWWPIWISHLATGAAEAIVAANIAAYSLFVGGRVIRADFLYFLCALGLLCAGYAGAVMVAGPAYSFEMLRLTTVLMVVVVLSHALIDLGRQQLDGLFFGTEVRRLRTELAALSQAAAVSPDLGPVLDRARAEIATASAEYLDRLTEEALRALGKPAALARCQLAERLPYTLAAAGAPRSGDDPGTPLARTQALRDALIQAIERLRPRASDPASKAGALQYSILREEYVLERPNKQIMIRHSIGEGTFHRNRREAIHVLAMELSEQERQLARRALTGNEVPASQSAPLPSRFRGRAGTLFRFAVEMLRPRRPERPLDQ